LRGEIMADSKIRLTGVLVYNTIPYGSDTVMRFTFEDECSKEYGFEYVVPLGGDRDNVANWLHSMEGMVSTIGKKSAYGDETES
jgi:hypothetical protein